MTADILQFPTPQPKDGGKERILRKRRAIRLEHMFHGSILPDDLTQGHADQMPSDSPYCAAESDPA
jgi:hypothetical protein